MEMRRKRHPFGFLGHSGIERTGTLVLVAVLVLTICVPPLLRRYGPQRRLSAVEMMNTAEFISQLGPKPLGGIEQPMRLDLEEVPPSREPMSFAFDPNTITSDSLLMLGLSAKQAAAIVRYRVAGGQFRTSADLGKLRALDERTCQRLQPLVRIASQRRGSQRPAERADLRPSPKTTHPADAPAAATLLLVELNTADTAALRNLRGIGATLSQRIVDYRARLGGYHSVEQLAEVRGIKPELIERLRPQLRIDTTLVQRIAVNSATYEQLRQHPYINDFEAKAIVYYRSTMGKLSQPADLLRNKLLTPERYSRLKPYIIVE